MEIKTFLKIEVGVGEEIKEAWKIKIDKCGGVKLFGSDNEMKVYNIAGIFKVTITFPNNN